MTIKGYATDSDTASTISASVGLACDARGLPRFIGITPIPIYAGAYKGKMFLPLDDISLEQVLWRGIKMKDFPEFQQIIETLGGLDARIEIPEDALILKEIVEDEVVSEETAQDEAISEETTQDEVISEEIL